MTYKRKLATVKLSNLRKGRGRGKKHQDSPNQGETREETSRDEAGSAPVLSPPGLSPHSPPPPPPPPQQLSPPASLSLPSTSRSCSSPVPPTSPTTAESPMLLHETSLERRQNILQQGVRPVDPKTSESDSYFTVSLQQLNKLFATPKCTTKACKSTLTVTADHGALQTRCTRCDTLVASAAAPLHPRDSDYSVIKLREVYFSLISGIGYNGVRLNEALLTGGKMNNKTFHKYCSFLYQEMNPYFEEKMVDSRKAVFKYYTEELHVTPDENGILDVDISYDASWMKRGHKSHIGIGFAVEVNTGFILDLDVLSNFCRTCNTGSNKQHDCQKNFDGKAGAMEAEIAKRIWCRSLQYKMRFTTFVGDGDSSAYNNLCQVNGGKGPYTVPVVKEECVNHVSKRMGTRLRKIKKEAYETITTKTGKKMKRSILGGVNMLTDEVIDRLSSYYGKAIRDYKNCTVKEMQGAIWASYYHLSSSNQHPYHHFCPKGEDSWCFYRRATALGLPESAKDHSRKNLYLAKIPQERLQYIKSVYKDLGNPNLLKRCLKGATQNPNESLHSKVWNKCQKIKFYSRLRVKFLVQHSALEHNFGYEAGNFLLHTLGPDANFQGSLKWFDKERSRHATPKSKKIRKEKKSDSYEAGGF